MEIIAHRGLWGSEDQKNTLGAFRDSLMKGFGIETDVRDFCGEPVISHDVPDRTKPLFKELLELYSRYPGHAGSGGNGGGLPLAINIKADGLQPLLRQHLMHHPTLNYFLFDMSVPETLIYQKNDMAFFTRHSEYEPVPGFYPESSGVWMDCFREDWFTKESIKGHLDRGKRVCIVSPELHKRPYLPVWESLKEWGLSDNKGLMICTDHPEQCREFFNG